MIFELVDEGFEFFLYLGGVGYSLIEMFDGELLLILHD
jgi:hypothetical protein